MDHLLIDPLLNWHNVFHFHDTSYSVFLYAVKLLLTSFNKLVLKPSYSCTKAKHIQIYLYRILFGVEEIHWLKMYCLLFMLMMKLHKKRLLWHQLQGAWCLSGNYSWPVDLVHSSRFLQRNLYIKYLTNAKYICAFSALMRKGLLAKPL